jgi:electron transfer flavoprotein beta subunit
VDGGVEVVSLRLPAVVTCDLRLNKPRFASLPGIMKARKAAIPQVPAEALVPGLAPSLVVRRFAEPPKRKGGVKVADVEELWRRLHDEAKVL